MEHAPSSVLASPEQCVQPWLYSKLFHLSLFLSELCWLPFSYSKSISYWATEVKQTTNEK